MAIQYKSINLVEEGDFACLQISGKLETSDYDVFVPEIEQQIKQYGKINLLIDLIDFHGWTLGAAWEDTKFGVRHFNDINRLAIVGDKTWEKGMAVFVKVFTLAEVKYFDISSREEAILWVNS